ncbi:MAG: 4-hydroxy-tetrahydrodipicolinate synthase [Flavobacteriales bacterium]|nr:4-hydroxy-tetrahydrodipicolinate synthase [Flavobacteriales bacterium]
MIQHKFTGLGVAMITPMSADESIDFPALERLTLRLCSSEVDFLVVLGSTGEAALLSEEERVAVLEFVLEISAGAKPIVAGLDVSGGTRAVVQRLQSMHVRGLSGLLVSPPPYILPVQSGLLDLFQRLDKVTPVPIIAYNVPSRAGVEMAPDTIIEMAATTSNVVALKQAVPSVDAMRKIIAGVPKDFAVLAGDDGWAVPAMSLGGQGLISVIGNAFPDMWGRAMNQAVFGQVKSAEDDLRRFEPLLELLFAEGNPAGIKALCSHLGLCEMHVRRPLMPASKKLTQDIYDAVAALDAVPA